MANILKNFRYIQLVEKDIIKFGLSTREYILLHDRSQQDEENDIGLDWYSNKIISIRRFVIRKV